MQGQFLALAHKITLFLLKSEFFTIYFAILHWQTEALHYKLLIRKRSTFLRTPKRKSLSQGAKNGS